MLLKNDIIGGGKEDETVGQEIKETKGQDRPLRGDVFLFAHTLWTNGLIEKGEKETRNEGRKGGELSETLVIMSAHSYDLVSKNWQSRPLSTKYCNKYFVLVILWLQVF